MMVRLYLMQVEFLGRVQKQEQDDAWYTCINYISICGKPLYGFVPAGLHSADCVNHRELLLEKVGPLESALALIVALPMRDCTSLTLLTWTDAGELRTCTPPKFLVNGVIEPYPLERGPDGVCPNCIIRYHHRTRSMQISLVGSGLVWADKALQGDDGCARAGEGPPVGARRPHEGVRGGLAAGAPGY